MKKSLVCILCLLVAVSFTVYSGGAQEEAVVAIEVSAPGEFPIVQDKITLTYFTDLPPDVISMADNDMTRYMEDLTNVHIEWEVVPYEAATEKRSLILASGDYPDALHSAGDPGVTREEIMRYGPQGVFIPLNDLIEKHGFELKKAFKEVPMLRKTITTPDGNIYDLPTINQCYHCYFSQKMWINMPWLEKLGLDMPTTTEEFYQVLKAFKTQDPNGNGKADEVPLSGAIIGSSGSWHSSIGCFLMNAFIYYDEDGPASTRFLAIDNGKVYFVANRPQWREGLRYLNRLYSEGLIDPAAFTQDGAQLRMLGENPDVVLMGAFASGWFGVATKNAGESGRYKMYDTVPPLTGPAGFRAAGHYPGGIDSGVFVITDKCKYPEVAYKWADHLYSLKATLNSVMGREGEEWRWARDGEIGINGKPAIWHRVSTYELRQNWHWNQNGINYRPFDIYLGRLGVPMDELYTPGGLETRLYVETKNKYDGKEPEQVYPTVVYMSKDQITEIASVKTDIFNYVTESMARFAIGELSLDTDWNSYVNELDAMGVDRYVELHDAAYRAQYGQ